MSFRDSGFVQPLGALLAVLVALTALAWSSHVDWPVEDSAAGMQAHAETTVLDAAADDVSPAQSADSGGHTDHCSHVSAHLVGLRASDVILGDAPLLRIPDYRSSPYDSIVRQPLIDPPIA